MVFHWQLIFQSTYIMFHQNQKKYFEYSLCLAFDNVFWLADKNGTILELF